MDKYGFHPVIEAWFRAKFGNPTGVQDQAWEHIRAGKHTLIASPTGSGKTLAALLPCLDAIVKNKQREAEPGTEGAAPRGAGVRVVYVTPLKALNNDIGLHVVHFAKELEEKAAVQTEAAAAASGQRPEHEAAAWPGVTVGVRTGDTPQNTRASMLRKPPDVLVTTPESLYLLLTSPRARDMLRTVRHVIVDEIHDLAGDKRGMHLSLTLERLGEWCGCEPQRIGVSATQKPIERVARFLGGWSEAGEPRAVRIVEHRGDKRYELRVGLPAPLAGPAASADDAVWTPLVKRVLALMESEAARTTLVFVKSRTLSERLTLRLNEQAGYELARAHHGSVAREQRLEVETLLKEGRLRCLVATSSLELGIDVGHVDLVIQIDAPPSAAAALQRIGRAGHAAGAVSRAALLARSRGKLAELAALARRVAARDIEALRVPREGLDVLAQQVVAMLAAGDDWTLERLERLLSRSDSYRGLPRERLTAMLDTLAGYYPFVRPLIEWDRATGRLGRLAATSMAAILGAGTIPQSTAYPVHHHESGLHLGELDEEYIHESQVGDVFQLGASSWRIQRIQADRVYVTETANRFSEIPFWRGEGASRSLELSRDVGRLWRELDERLHDAPETAGTANAADAANAANAADMADAPDTPDTIDAPGASYASDAPPVRPISEADTAAPARPLQPGAPLPEAAARTAADLAAARWLSETCFLEPEAAEQLVQLARSQRAHTPLPTDRTVVLEQYTDEQNRVHMVLHSLFGRTVNRTWLLAIGRTLQDIGIKPIHATAKDNGIELVFAYGERTRTARDAIAALTPEAAYGHVLDAAAGSPYFAASFRELAQTSLLLSRSFTRVPAFVLRLRTEELLKEALPFKDRFPLFAEALRVTIEQKLDLPGLQEVLGGLADGSIRWAVCEAAFPSPMTAQYEFDYVSANMYESDAVPADVQLELMGISRKLAEDMFGPAAGPRIDNEAMEAERARLNEPELALQEPQDLLRVLKERGEHTREELLALGIGQLDAWLDRLEASRSVASIRLTEATGTAYCSGEETVLYASLQTDPAAAMFILKRYADSRFSFTLNDILQRYPITADGAEAWLEAASTHDIIQAAPFAHGEEERIWMSSKAASRLIRLSIRTFRASREGLSAERYASKLLELQRIAAPEQTTTAEDPAAALKEALRPLQGWFAPVGQWESLLLPARLPNYRKEHLDLLCAAGEVVWIGRKMDGDKEGQAAFFLTEDKDLFAPIVGMNRPDTAYPELLQLLRERGASFLSKLSLESGLQPSTLHSQLMQLVWEGHAANDQFAPLREYAAGGSRKADKFRSGLGRWYAVADSFPAAALGDVQREASALRWTRHLLDSYGIVSKPLVAAICPFSWDTVAAVLKQLELLGHVSRGLFLKEIESIQFASPSLLTELAEPSVSSAQPANAHPGAGDAILLSAVDPANALGWLLPWPAAGKTAGYARKPGNWLLRSRTHWLLWLENGAKRIATPPEAGQTEAATSLNGPSHLSDQSLKSLLQQIAVRQGLRKIVIDAWNGLPIMDAPEGKRIKELGAERDRSSYVLWSSQLR
ncbi:DEAD/DEAH box helicase [Paenibacillus chartarius]|uniref:DEAD/DEAH box helicase n=1 Tax=Paenibacillus chartarius TaxID=747481 RepID=A0ABV6DJ45_9BACL